MDIILLNAETSETKNGTLLMTPPYINVRINKIMKVPVLTYFSTPKNKSNDIKTQINQITQLLLLINFSSLIQI